MGAGAGGLYHGGVSTVNVSGAGSGNRPGRSWW